MATSVTRWRGVLVAAVIGALWPLTQLAHPLDLRAWDLGFAALVKWHPAPPVTDIAVIGLDEATLSAVPEPVALLHKQLGGLLQTLAASGAKAVALDVVLPDRSFDAIVPGYDVALLQGILAMRGAGILVLARTVDEAGSERAIHPPLLAAAGAEGSGFALLPVDRDGTIRRIDEGLGDHGADVATLVGQVARRLGAAVAPGLIDYAHPVGVAPVSMLAVLDEFRAGHTAALKAAFANKIVFVGALLPFVDRHRVPVALGAEHFPVGATPGVYIHAQALQTLLSGGPITVVPGAASLLAALLCALAWRVCSNWGAALLTIIAGLVALALISPAMLAARHAVPVASPALALITCALLRFGLEVRAEISARRRLRQTFAGYVSPAVMAELEAGRLDGMASARRFVCVMFLDVRGFTTRSESDSPEQVTSVLNRLFEAATDVIHHHGGTVKEFMGDGVMAFFGAPRSLPSPAQAGFDAARAMLGALDQVNTDLQKTGQAPLAIGIGLACGDAVVGHIGAASRHAYGAVGDCVNLASRLEGLTKSLGHPLLMSAAVQALIDDRSQVVSLGGHAIKGHSAVEVFGYPRSDR